MKEKDKVKKVQNTKKVQKAKKLPEGKLKIRSAYLRSVCFIRNGEIERDISAAVKTGRALLFLFVTLLFAI